MRHQKIQNECFGEEKTIIQEAVRANTDASLFSKPSRRPGPRNNNEQDLVVN